MSIKQTAMKKKCKNFYVRIIKAGRQAVVSAGALKKVT